MIIVINDSGSQGGCVLLKGQKPAHQMNFIQKEKKRKDVKVMVPMMTHGNLSLLQLFAVNAILGCRRYSRLPDLIVTRVNIGTHFHKPHAF